MDDQKKCGAKTRSGKPCRRPGTGIGGRCDLHGGAAGSGRPIIHGRFSKQLPPKLKEAYERSEGDERLLSLRSDAALFDALIQETLPKLIDSEQHAELWENAIAQFDEITKALASGDTKQARISIQLLGQVLKNGLGGLNAENRALELVERKARILEAEHKRLKMLNDHLDSRQAMALITFLMQSVMANVKDPDAIRAIQHDFARATGQLGQRSTLEAS
ncbi:MAG TPA: HGGxSTG domain-containing protein [Fimbriimonas sp.]|nr:HGGxSTG domain-containing protein [Fimbriimonas sp.]